MEPGTRDHAPPARPSERRHRPALVVAFPRPAAALVPSSEEAVGRAWLASLGLADDEASGQHAWFLRQRGGTLEIRDAGSRNGTWVDGARLAHDERARLSDGSVIRIGRTLLVYRERFTGPLAPSEPLGGLVGPYGLRAVASALSAIGRARASNVLIVGETGTARSSRRQRFLPSLGAGCRCR